MHAHYEFAPSFARHTSPSPPPCPHTNPFLATPFIYFGICAWASGTACSVAALATKLAQHSLTFPADAPSLAPPEKGNHSPSVPADAPLSAGSRASPETPSQRAETDAEGGSAGGKRAEAGADSEASEEASPMERAKAVGIRSSRLSVHLSLPRDAEFAVECARRVLCALRPHAHAHFLCVRAPAACADDAIQIDGGVG